MGPHRSPPRLPCLALAVLALTSALSACSRKSEPQGKALALSEPIPEELPRATTLRLGDPQTQKRLELTGQLDTLPFSVEWHQLSGGPQTIEAFRAAALDGGTVGDTPPIHAIFTGLDVKIISVQVRTKPAMRLATSPGANVDAITGLRGKKIAYSPGQAQGALVLRVLKKAGLTQKDVTLIELSSSEFKDALGSRQVDVAPLSGPILMRYLKEYGKEGGGAFDHGVRDSLAFFYVRTEVLQDAHKAAALRAYVAQRIEAQRWSYDHPDAWIEGYYVKDQGLSTDEGRYVVDALGRPEFPSDWSEAIALTQETIDLLAEASGRKRFDAHQLFDRRFEKLAQASSTLGKAEPSPHQAARNER